jgi:hypothetical protein
VDGQFRGAAESGKGCSFLKKRTKKPLDFGAPVPANAGAKMQKSFASFLQKRRLSLL